MVPMSVIIRVLGLTTLSRKGETMETKTQRTYYWEHSTDESRYLRSSSAREMAELLHAVGGEAGVIIDDGGPLVVRSVTAGATADDTTAALKSL